MSESQAESDAPETPDLGSYVLVATALLTALGLVIIYAASSLKGAEQLGDEFFFLKKQTFGVGVGIILAAAIARIPFAWLERSVLPLLLVTTGVLALIFVPGLYTEVGGAKRWLRFGPVGGQPAELAKLALVFFLAKNLSRPSLRIERFTSGILPNLVVFSLFAGLLLLQSDLGTPALLFAVTVLMLYVAGVSRKFLTVAGVGAVGALAAAIAVEPYRMARIMSFLDPWSQMESSGFQIIQSFVAFQNGGLFGVGLGESRQKLFFLPEAHTDFILSVIGEELGLVGVAFVTVVFLYLVHLGYRIAALQTEPFKKFLAFGLTSLLALQALLNMGVAMGLLPTKGIPLPFLSSGSSSLVVFLCVAAVLARLDWERQTEARDPG